MIMRLIPPLFRGNYHFRQLWLAGFVSALGDYIFLGALGVWVALLTDSPAKVGLVLAAEVAGMLALGAVAGVLVDRWPKRRVMIAIDLARAGALLPLLLVRDGGDFPLLMAGAFVLSGLSRFFGPAKAVMLKEIVPAEELTAASGLEQLAFNIARLAGPVIGAWVVASAGAAPILLADAASFLFSAWCLRKLPRLLASEAARQGKFWRQFAAGFVVIRRSRILALLFFAIALVCMGAGALNALDTFFVLRCLHLPARDVGVFGSAIIVGFLCGSGLGAGGFFKRLGAPRFFGWAVLMMGVFLSGYALAPNIVMAMLFLLGAGLGNGLANVALPAILIGAVAGENLGKVYGLLETGLGAVTLLGTALAGACAERLGIRPVLAAAGVFIVAAGLVSLRMRGKDKAAGAANQSLGEPA